MACCGRSTVSWSTSVLSILRPSGFWPDSVPPGNYSRIVAIAVLVGWLLNGFGSWRFERAKWIFASLLAYWAWMAICAFQAGNQDAAWNAVDSQSRILFPVAIGLTLVKSRQQLIQLAWVLVISQATIAFVGHVSVYITHTGNWLGEQGMGGYDNNDLAAGNGVGMRASLRLGDCRNGCLAKMVGARVRGVVRTRGSIELLAGRHVGLAPVWTHDRFVGEGRTRATTNFWPLQCWWPSVSPVHPSASDSRRSL